MVAVFTVVLVDGGRWVQHREVAGAEEAAGLAACAAGWSAGGPGGGATVAPAFIREVKWRMVDA